ncbi:UBP1-associated proteins 1C [Bienertia sinuspersici]
MVWFQCEACGEELKKPKLPNHFRQCSAYKLSCLDCGQTFNQQSVQGHTQCITEAEKYGPKGQAKATGSTPSKPSNDKQKPDVDTSVGLSERPPWFCSLCNTQATSKQALLLHADGKKHRAKARAYAFKQQPNPPAEGAVANKDSAESTPKNEVPKDKSSEDVKENGLSNGASGHDKSVNGNVYLKKRKNDLPSYTEKCTNGVSNGTVIQAEETPKKSKKARQGLEAEGTKNKEANYETEKEAEKGKSGSKTEGSEQKIKWKKLIASVLKSTPDGALKMKKLQKLVLKSLQESGITIDDSDFRITLEHKVNSSSKYKVDGKYVRLAA